MDTARNQVNSLFAKKEPWQIAAISTASTLFAVWFFQFLIKEESWTTRAKKTFFRVARKIPSIKKKIDTELDGLQKNFEETMTKQGDKIGYIVKLPEDGWHRKDILKKIDEYLELGNIKWQEGYVSGAVYHFDSKIIDLMTKVYGKTSYTNPLHADIFPGICKMEAEVLRMTANLFNGSSSTCGSITTGGTESILLACKSYRDYGRDVNGIKYPNMVVPTTAHSAFDKAAQYLGITVKTVKLEANTYKVDIKAMERAINGNTIMLVGSAPNYPYGTMDDIEKIAKLARKYKIPLHVDCCLGGFLTVFMERAGYSLPKFDFSVKGVTSISADTHKYGFTPKGSSVILYSDKKYRHHQYTVTTNWPGGIYGSPTVSGSRAGATVACTWACLLFHGLDGYVESTKAIIDTSRYIEDKLRKIYGIFIFGTPATSVIAIGSDVFDIFRLSDGMHQKGWNLNILQFPSGIHICVTNMHTRPGVADNFINDVESIVAALVLDPQAPVEGKMALYGVAQEIPDRSIVGDFTKLFLDSLTFTPKRPKKFKKSDRSEKIKDNQTESNDVTLIDE
ncbi:CLUMA_CG002394, isoform A [Clunio marinus]|uniref:sphinganine-1-phosphate aldolase n=1 Tax=Clunio marinus TaxID=568069 RepID=A0A1J1HKR3_9DIPT|nr:CLUMA_CG002394, isoform A [Clunio marinus]